MLFLKFFPILSAKRMQKSVIKRLHPYFPSFFQVPLMTWTSFSQKTCSLAHVMNFFSVYAAINITWHIVHSLTHSLVLLVHATKILSSMSHIICFLTFFSFSTYMDDERRYLHFSIFGHILKCHTQLCTSSNGSLYSWKGSSYQLPIVHMYSLFRMSLLAWIPECIFSLSWLSPSPNVILDSAGTCVIPRATQRIPLDCNKIYRNLRAWARTRV